MLGDGFAQNSYYQLIMTVVPVWAVMGLAWNVLSGYSGFRVVRPAAFFGLGAYSVALAQIHWGRRLLGIPLAGVGRAGRLVVAFHVSTGGHYFALAMLAYPLALLYCSSGWLPGTDAADASARRRLNTCSIEDHRVYACWHWR